MEKICELCSLKTDKVDHVVMGTVLQEPRTSNIAREVCCHGDDVPLSLLP